MKILELKEIISNLDDTGKVSQYEEGLLIVEFEDKEPIFIEL